MPAKSNTKLQQRQMRNNQKACRVQEPHFLMPGVTVTSYGHIQHVTCLEAKLSLHIVHCNVFCCIIMLPNSMSSSNRSWLIWLFWSLSWD